MRYIFLSHLGIGDHIIMNGLVHAVLNNTPGLEELCILAVDDYRKGTLLHLYEDYPRVSFHWLEPGLKLHFNGNDYIGIAFGLHSLRKNYWIDKGTNWIDCLYKYPFQLDSNKRFSEFHMPSNLSGATRKYEQLIEILGTTHYVVVHDDPARNRNVQRETLCSLLYQDGMNEYPIVYLGYNRNHYPFVEGLHNKDVGDLLNCDSLFDLVFILANASACHLMDSCIACLVDVSSMGGKLYMHNYINEASGGAFTRHPWVQVDLHS
jgi:hypothetical protein